MIRWRSPCRLSFYRSDRSSSGFTILEIVAVLAVMALALSLGFYSMGDWRARGKFTGTINGVRNAIQLTRARAIARQKPVVLQFAKPIPLSQWSHSENYVILERRSDDGLTDAEPTNNSRPSYWIEFRFVDERMKDGSAACRFLVGDATNPPTTIDSSLNYSDTTVRQRGQICFDGRGYAVTPPCEWKTALNATCGAAPASYTPVPQQYLVEIVNNNLKRTVDVTVSVLGQVATKLP